MKKGAPEFAICNTLKADRFLFLDCMDDVLILDAPQFIPGYVAIEKPLARCHQRRGAQQTAHMVGAKGWVYFRHKTYQ